VSHICEILTSLGWVECLHIAHTNCCHNSTLRNMCGRTPCRIRDNLGLVLDHSWCNITLKLIIQIWCKNLYVTNKFDIINIQSPVDLNTSCHSRLIQTVGYCCYELNWSIELFCFIIKFKIFRLTPNSIII